MMETRYKNRVGLLALIGVAVLWPATLLAEEKTPDANIPTKGSVAEPRPAEALPSDGDDYRVGSGDVIEISVWGEPEISSVVVVRPDGKLSLPLVNDLYVTGKTPMVIQEIVIEKLTPFINSPSVTVTVKEIRSKKIYVIGEVARTGAYQITQPTTVLQILTEAGGLLPFAKQKGIYVLRTKNGIHQRFPFNYKDVLKGKKIGQNILLEPGDTVVVP